MKQLLLVSLLLCLSFQVGACSRGPESTTQAAKEPALTDSALKDKIEANINTDADLRAANLSVSADADHNKATVSGTVESEALRSKAVQMAKDAHPGVTLEDKIDVKPREIARSDYTADLAHQEVEKAKANKETVGDSLDDAWIHSKIVAKLIADLHTPELKINVDVDKNVVTLRGAVDSLQQKQEAERISKETDGVKRVNNRLTISKG